MVAVVSTDYRTPEQKEETLARIAADEATENSGRDLAGESDDLDAISSAPASSAGTATAVATAPAKTLKPAMVPAPKHRFSLL